MDDYHSTLLYFRKHSKLKSEENRKKTLSFSVLNFLNLILCLKSICQIDIRFLCISSNFPDGICKFCKNK